MRRGFLLLVTLAAAAILVGLTTFQVREGTTAIVARFGDPRQAVVEPGLYFKWPYPIEDVIEIDRRLNLLDPEPSEYLTADKKNLVVDVFLAWRVADPVKYWVSVNSKGGAELRLTDVLRSTVGQVLSSVPFSALVSHEPQEQTMTDVVAAITERAAPRVSNDFGVEVVAIRIKRVNFPQQNKDAVFARMEQEREKISATIRQEGVEQFERIKAEADREEARLIAEAERVAKEVRGAAEAEATAIEAAAYAKDPELFELVMRLKILEEALNDESILILPSDHELLDVLEGPPRHGTKDGGESP